MKSDIELKAIAFDRYMDAASSDGATIEMKVASITLNTLYSAEKHKDSIKEGE